MGWLTLTHTQAGTPTTGPPAPAISTRVGSSPSPCNLTSISDDLPLRRAERPAAGLMERPRLAMEQPLGASATASEERPDLVPWPIDRPHDWTRRVNRPFVPEEEEAVVRSIQRGQPFGSVRWQIKTAARLGLESSLPSSRPSLQDRRRLLTLRPESPRTGRLRPRPRFNPIDAQERHDLTARLTAASSGILKRRHDRSGAGGFTSRWPSSRIS